MTWFALLSWPLVAAVVFGQARLPIAVLVTIVGGYLLLPTQTRIDLPILPGLEKNSIPALIALLFVLIKTRSQNPSLSEQTPQWPVLPGLLPREPVVLVLFLMLFVGNIGTHMTNSDPLFFGPLVLPSLRPYDAVSAIMATFLQLLPFLLARKVLSTAEGQRLIMVVIVIAALCYTLPALYEARMSPQLNQMIYGFFPHSWIQHWRGSSWRPIVFLGHGLELSIYFSIAVLSAATLTKTEGNKSRMFWVLAMFWLLLALIVTRSLGALLIALTFLVVIYFTPKRLQITMAFGICCLILLYPVVRTAGILPYEQLLSSVSAERAHSFNVRLKSEEILLAHANERPLFGWGGWGRSRTYDENGLDTAITDGAWIIWLGVGGWLQYISVVGLLSWGVLKLFWQRGRDVDAISIGLGLALTANIVDLIPNSNLTPMTWLLAGALCGRLEWKGAASEPRDAATQQDNGPEAFTVYSRNLSPSLQSSHKTKVSPRPRNPSPYRRNFSNKES